MKSDTSASHYALNVELLGHFRIRGEDHAPVAMAQGRLQVLLAYLLLHRAAPIARRQLAFALWPDTNDQQALSNLRTLLHRLQDCVPALHNFVQLDRHTVTWLNDADMQLDVNRFEGLLAQAAQAHQPGLAIAALQSAVDTYTGDLLPGCYDEWIIKPRERLLQNFVHALEQLISLQEQQSQLDAAIRNAQRLLRLDLLHEAGHRQLIKLHAANNDRASALRAYHRCVAILRRELGVDPDVETRLLHQRLLYDEERPVTTNGVQAVAASAQPQGRRIGRQQEWNRLLDGWREASTGAARMVLVCGEAGIGTTYLAEELAAWLSKTGNDVVVARCHASTRPLPYHGISSWLRSPAIRSRLLSLNSHQLDEISRLLPDIATGRQISPASRLSTAPVQRQSLFDALAAPFLQHTRPTLLWIDDIHHCDSETLAWLHYVLDKLHATRLLVLGTAHSEDVDSNHPLVALRLNLQTRGLWREVKLGPLSAAESFELATLVANRSLSPCEARHLHRDSEGNPFFLIETLRSGLPATLEPQPDSHPDPLGPQCLLCPDRITPPPRIQAILEQRLAQLSPAGRTVAQMAAVIGREFPLRLLQHVSLLDEEVLIPALAELCTRGVIREQNHEGYDFSHEKLRAAAYAHAGSAQRRLWHRRVAHALQALSAEGHSATALLAHHFNEAGDVKQAAALWLQAGDEAIAIAAPAEAALCYRWAIHIFTNAGDKTSAGLAMMRLGTAHHSVSDFAAAQAAYSEGFNLLSGASGWQSIGRSLPPNNLATLRLAGLAPRTLDPISDDDRDGWLVDELFSGLVMQGPDMAILPDVARDWLIEDGGRTYTFRLRQDVDWSDGTPVTAGDFEYAWRRFLHPSVAAYYTGYAGLLDDIVGALAFRCGETAEWRDVGVRVLDRSTLRVTLVEPANSFLSLLSHRVTFPVPKHVVERYGRAWAEPGYLVSNGPFRLAGAQAEGRLRLERNPAYHGHYGGNVGHVEVKLLAERREQVALYEAGQLDFIPIHRLHRDEAIRLHRRHPGQFHMAPDLRVDYLALNTQRPPFDDARVRRAFAMAVDRHYIAHGLMYGYELPASGGFIPPKLVGHTPGIALPFDPAAAQKLLAEAGYPDGRGLPTIELWAGHGMSTWATAGEYVIQQWRQVLGAPIVQRMVSPDDLLRPSSPDGPHGFCIGWGADYPDADSFLRIAPIGHLTGWRHAGYDRLVAQARGLSNQVERQRLYAQAEAILVEEAPVVPLTYHRWYALLSPRLTHFPVSPMQRWFLKDVQLAPL